MRARFGVELGRHASSLRSGVLRFWSWSDVLVAAIVVLESVASEAWWALLVPGAIFIVALSCWDIGVEFLVSVEVISLSRWWLLVSLRFSQFTRLPSLMPHIAQVQFQSLNLYQCWIFLILCGRYPNLQLFMFNLLLSLYLIQPPLPIRFLLSLYRHASLRYLFNLYPHFLQLSLQFFVLHPLLLAFSILLGVFSLQTSDLVLLGFDFHFQSLDLWLVWGSQLFLVCYVLLCDLLVGFFFSVELLDLSL